MPEPLSVAKLTDAIKASYDDLDPFRESRRRLVKQYVGPRWGQARSPKTRDGRSLEGEDATQLYPLLRLAVSVFKCILVPDNPRFLVQTFYPDLRPQGLDIQAELNKIVERMDMRGKLQNLVVDALFGLAIVKVGVAPAGNSMILGIRHDPGRPYVDNVSLDDWFHDTQAKRWEDVRFCGNRYTVSKRELEESGLYDPAVIAKIPVLSEPQMNPDGSERTSSLAFGAPLMFDAALEDMVELCDVWIPKRNCFVTLGCDDSGPSNVVLSHGQWTGHPLGPYRTLMFDTVPDSTMPTADMEALSDLDSLVNSLGRRNAQNAKQAKTVLTTSASAVEDANRVMNAKPGQVIRSDHREMLQPFTFPGVDASSFAYMADAIQRFSYFAGNLESMAGLAVQSGTARQDQLLKDSSGTRPNSMQQLVVAAARAIGETLGWYLFHNPVAYYTGTRKVENTTIEVGYEFVASNRQGDWIDYNFDIDAYSLQYMSPGQKAQELERLAGQVLVPLAPILQSQGMMVNWHQLIHTLATYKNLPELENIVIYQNQPQYYQPPAMPRGQGNAGPGQGQEMPTPRMPTQTTRNYIRQSESKATPAGQNATLVSSLMGAPKQGAEMARMYS